MRVMIAEISTAIDEKNRVKETLSESVKKQEKESRRLSAELDKLNSLVEEGKPEKDFTTAKIKSEIVTLQLTSLHDYVIEEEKETQALRERVETMKKESGKLCEEEADIRFSINEKISQEPSKEKEEALEAEIAQLRAELDQNLEQLNHVGENEKRYDSDLTIVLNTIEDLRSEKEKLNEFPEGCVQAQKLQETIRRKKRELALLTDGTR